MKALTKKEIKTFIPECSEIRECPQLNSCIEKNKRSCDNKEKPCYITSKGEYLEGTILLDFKNNIVAIYKFHGVDTIIN